MADSAGFFSVSDSFSAGVSGAGLAVLLLQFVEDFKIIVGRIELRSEPAPNAMFECQIDFTEFIRRETEGNDVSDAHDNVVGDNLDSLRREVFPKPGFLEVIIDFIDCLLIGHGARMTVSMILPSAPGSWACR